MERYVIRVLESDQTVQVVDGVSVLDACLEGEVPFRYNCRSGECGECVAKLVSGEVRELAGADPAVFNDGHRKEGLILACMCYARSDLVLSTTLSSEPRSAVGLHDVTVKAIERHGSAIYEVTVEADMPIDYASGQYFEWVIPGISPNRSYSAANRSGSREVVFHVKTYDSGEVSQYLRRGVLRVGDALKLKGPFGSFGLGPRDYVPAVMVAGGTGLAPICSILEEAFARGVTRSIYLFFGVQGARDLYHLDQLGRWAGQHENFEFFPTVVDTPEGAEWNGDRGLVTDVIERRLVDAMGYEAYLCGPPGMIDAAAVLLESKGVDSDDIHADRFVAVA